MKTYYVLWTYIANFSGLIPVLAESPADALHKATHFFSADFHNNATTYVFEQPPSLMVKNGSPTMFAVPTIQPKPYPRGGG